MSTRNGTAQFTLDDHTDSLVYRMDHDVEISTSLQTFPSATSELPPASSSSITSQIPYGIGQQPYSAMRQKSSDRRRSSTPNLRFGGVHKRTAAGPSLANTANERQRVEMRMQRSLKYYFMNPWEKYQTKRRIPYKLLAQILKIVLVTVQLILFGHNSSTQVTFNDDNAMAFRHLYLEGWDSSQETPPYPASHGPFAAYTYEDFYSKINFAWERYYRTVETALGSFDFVVPRKPKMELCKRFFRVGNIFASNQSYEFDSHVNRSCVTLVPLQVINSTDNSTSLVFDSKEFLRIRDMTINFDRMLNVWLLFSVKTVQLKALDLDPFPNCFQFNITIEFDNSNHDGAIPVTLSSQSDEISCHGRIRHSKSQFLSTLLTGLDVFVILLTVVSCISCARSLRRGRRLYLKAKAFFLDHYNESLVKDRFEFLNGWFILIILNDLLIIVGSAVKIKLDNKLANDYTICAYLLGIGGMLVWFGVLRYMAYSYKNYVLILTVRHAIPTVLRFMLCGLAIFLAFSLCGWVVLGPFHVKFRSFSTSLECLYSLINGDDMFTTFSIVPGNDPNTMVALFTRVYLYTFSALFIYVVLNLFITLIIEVYEDVKKMHANRGRQSTFMWRFIRGELPQQATSDSGTNSRPRSPMLFRRHHRHHHHHHHQQQQHNRHQGTRDGDSTWKSVSIVVRGPLSWLHSVRKQSPSDQGSSARQAVVAMTSEPSLDQSNETHPATLFEDDLEADPGNPTEAVSATHAEAEIEANPRTCPGVNPGAEGHSSPQPADPVQHDSQSVPIVIPVNEAPLVIDETSNKA